MAAATRSLGGLLARGPVILSLVFRAFFMLFNLPLLHAIPVRLGLTGVAEESAPLSPDNPTLWIYLAVAVGLVVLGGIFAGLTIALMGQDEIYLEVIKTSGDGAEKRHAAKVLQLLKKGKHWVLVTLLLGNVITNETLPIVLDRSLGGGWPAVLGSTVLIVIFGEIIPQSVCVRYGLPIGAFMYWPVRGMMWLFLPIALPTARLLDWLLGEDHGTTYKKAGLKTLVTLHKSLGAAGEQLNEDEVTIIGAVLDLKEKAIGSIMTPMKDVFTMSTETILDRKAIKKIRDAGFSRIPIHSPDNPLNFVGMLLVKQLMGYDKDDCKPVGEFALATLPETSPEASCLDIINFFQEGKSHMVLVSEHPGRDSGALGVVTLEDVMEELIGEEIVDESDVFINVEQGIRRKNAAQFLMLKNKGKLDQEDDSTDTEEDLIDLDVDHGPHASHAPRHASIDTVLDHKATPDTEDIASSPRPLQNMRRTSSITATSDSNLTGKRSDRERIKFTPVNLASRPRQTRNKTVTIKPGTGTMGDLSGSKAGVVGNPPTQPVADTASCGVGESLLISAGKDAKDGVHALQTTYGSIHPPPRSPKSPTKSTGSVNIKIYGNRPDASRKDSEDSQSTIGSLQERETRPTWTQIQKRSARSGSITENIIETNGVKKVVLEMASSSSEAEKSADEGVLLSQPKGEDKAKKKDVADSNNLGKAENLSKNGNEDSADGPLPQPKGQGKAKERDEAVSNDMGMAEDVSKNGEEESADGSGDDHQDENSKPGDGSEVKSGKKKRRRKRKKAGAAYAKSMAAAGRTIPGTEVSPDGDKPEASHGDNDAGALYSEGTPLLARQ